MADWKEMYLKMFRASEKAMRILEAAQLECEEMYMRDGDEEAERAEREAEELDNMEDDYELEEGDDADDYELEEGDDADDYEPDGRGDQEKRGGADEREQTPE